MAGTAALVSTPSIRLFLRSQQTFPVTLLRPCRSCASRRTSRIATDMKGFSKGKSKDHAATSSQQNNTYERFLKRKISNFLTAYEAKSFIEVAESIGFTHQGSLGPANGEAFRDNDRISVIDPLLAESLWASGLKKVFDDIKLHGKTAVGLNPNIRFYRYIVGQKFGRHIDESVDLEQGGRTYYTLLVYLSGGLSSKGKTNPGTNDSSMQLLAGGETVFYDKKHGVVAEVAPLEGMALLHLHGAKCMLHEARSVTKSVKYVLRSDVAFA